jgi:hypothetical protein
VIARSAAREYFVIHVAAEAVKGKEESAAVTGALTVKPCAVCGIAHECALRREFPVATTPDRDGSGGYAICTSNRRTTPLCRRYARQSAV